MAKILIGIVAVIACFYLADALQCNQCSAGVFGFCASSSTPNCTTNTSVCYSSRAQFSAISSFKGFNQQGCTESSTCPNNSVSTNGTLIGNFLGISYTISTTCCATDKCNTVDLSGGATANTMSLTAALSVAALAAVWGSYM